MKTAILNVRMEKEEYEALVRLAASQERSVAVLVRKAIKQLLAVPEK